MDMTVGGGRRCSAANAYLRPAMRRQQSHRAHARARHARAVRGAARRRRALPARRRHARGARAARGASCAQVPINTPQLLKLSGVGPGAELAACGIAVVHDLPGVGENLQDHLEFYFQVASREPITLYAQISAWRRALIGARWLLTRDGLGASNHFETGGFIRSRAGVRYPDIQFHFLPLAVSYDGSSLAREHGFQAHVGPMRSRSQGWVRLRSAAAARSTAHLLQLHVVRPEDWQEMRACVRLTREIFAQPAFDRYRGREIQPGERGAERCRRSMRSSAPRSRAPSTPPAPAGWVSPTDPTRGGRQRDARHRTSRRCGWSTLPSCRRSPPAISTRRPSCWRRRPPITFAAARCCRAPTCRTTWPPTGRMRSAAAMRSGCSRPAKPARPRCRPSR